MENLTDISVIKKICARYGFKFKKGFGQNFLCDEDIVNEIIYIPAMASTAATAYFQ